LAVVLLGGLARFLRKILRKARATSLQTQAAVLARGSDPRFQDSRRAMDFGRNLLWASGDAGEVGVGTMPLGTRAN
ncbi:unnamed protein product, partial [Pylaiella littoralis]